MARESFDKEIQFLRMLVLTSGAYTRQQFAQRLGISVHTFDKTIKRLKEVIHTVHKEAPATPGNDIAQLLKYNYYDSSDPLLLFLFRAKSVKESESYRLSALLSALQGQSLTATEIMDQLPAELSLSDEKTIRMDLKYLEEIGVIGKAAGGRPYRYQLRNELLTDLTDDELAELYDFVDVMANTQVPSVQGYLLRDHIKKARIQRSSFSERYLYKYHYHSRILDEAHLYSLFHAIRHRRKLTFRYFPPRTRVSYASKNTNPLFEKESEAGRSVLVLPLKVIYDHQYGRWYLLGNSPKLGIVKFRVEGITQLEVRDPVFEREFASKLQRLEEKIKHSWLVDTGRQVLVKARFFHPSESRSNFIKERVLLQGQWGSITDEDDDSFVYEILVNGTTEIKPWLRSFGSSCEVLEPLYLRRELIAEWKEIQSYYESIRENL